MPRSCIQNTEFTEFIFFIIFIMDKFDTLHTKTYFATYFERQ